MTKAEIRAELYAVRHELREMKNSHIRAFGAQHSERSIKICGACHVCEYSEGRISGLNFAIRHFGGRPWIRG